MNSHDICKNQKREEAAKMLINKHMNKQIVVYQYKRTLGNLKDDLSMHSIAYITHFA